MADTNENCPLSVAVPIAVSVNTSNTVPGPLTNVHASSATNGGFTKISKFTFTAKLTGGIGDGGVKTLSMQDYFDPAVSSTIAVWDFGDGYSLSATNELVTTHQYKVPGIYTVSMYFYDLDGNAHINTFTESISVYNKHSTDVKISTEELPGLTASDSGAQIYASSKSNRFNAGVEASWHDISPSGIYTLYVTASGSKAKPYDTKNKYAHLIPYNAFYTIDGDLIESDVGLQFELNEHWYVLSGSDRGTGIMPIATFKKEYFKDNGFEPMLLGASVSAEFGATDFSVIDGVTSVAGNETDAFETRATPEYAVPGGEAEKIPQITYYDDIPNDDPGVRLLFKLDTSKHKLKNFYVDGIDNDINESKRNFLESNSVGYYTVSGTNTIEGYTVKIVQPSISRLSFTSTGMKEMSAIQYKRQGDKFQVFIALADNKLNIGKHYTPFFKESLNNFITLLNSDFSSALSGSYADPSNWTIDAPTNTLTVTNSDFADATDWSAAISDQLGGVFNTVADPLPDPLSGWALSAENSGYAQHHPYTGGTVGGQIPAGQPAGPGHWSENYPHVNNLYQDVGAIGGKRYTVTVDVASCTAGNLRVFLGGEATSTNGLLLPVTNDVTDAGTHKVTLESTGGNPQNVYFQASNDFNGAIDNVSIVESSGNLGVDSGWDWSTGGGSGKATHTPITLWTGHTGLDNLYQDIDAIVGRKYIVKLTVASCTAGNLRVFLGGQATSDNGLLLPVTTDVTDNGTHKVTLNATGSILYFQASDDFNGTIDNVSVIESHDGGLGDGESGWDWSAGIATHTAISTWTNDTGLDNLYQDINATLGNEYTVKLTINSCTAGHIRLFIGTTDPTPPAHRPGLSANEIHTVIVKSTNNEPQRLFIQASPDFNGQVDDISIDCHQFYYDWSDGSSTITSNISSLRNTNLPFNTTSNTTQLSSFLYLNIDPLSAGTWTLNISGRADSFINSPATTIGQTIDYDPTGPLGPVSIGTDSNLNLITGSYTFTVLPSTNDVEVYKINEDIDYSQTIKSYRFQSFLHEYDKLFDGVFTSFVGEASSSPNVFGKTVFEKIANFVANNNDVDYCNMDNLQSFYDLFNEDIDIVLPTPPPELKRLYDLFSIKITKLLGDYERYDQSLNSNFYTSSADGRNIDFDNKITTSTYTVTTAANFVARQRFNNEFTLIRPQNVCSKAVSGADTDILSAYPLSAYNVYSNWGWPLDTSVSGSSGLDGFYDFYPYTAYDTTSANENIKNSIIDFNNNYNTITRSTTSLSADWENTGGVIYKNLDYQIRKGLSI